MASVARSSLILMATFLLVFGLHGQEPCDVEVKLLLSPTQVQTAIAALHARRETQGRIYFYDTSSLDLLSRGVILRLRAGAEIDLTAKLRPASDEKLVSRSGGSERSKCEADLNDGVETPSFSVENKFIAAKVPETGEELFQLLSEAQRKLLEDSKVQIDWKRIKRIAEIQSTSWKTHAQAPFGKLSLELWEWPSGRILEVSTKVAPETGQSTYVELRNFANRNGLVLSTNQRSKTAIALGQVTTAQQQ